MAGINDPATADRLLQKALASFEEAETETEPKRTWLIRESQAASSLATAILLRCKSDDDDHDDHDDRRGGFSMESGHDMSDVFPMR